MKRKKLTTKMKKRHKQEVKAAVHAAKKRKEPEIKMQEFWIVTGHSPYGDIRQVYPNEHEAERYAASRRGKRGYKNMTVHSPGSDA